MFLIYFLHCVHSPHHSILTYGNQLKIKYKLLVLRIQVLRYDAVWLSQWISTFRRHVMPSSLMFGESKKVKALSLFETSGRTHPAAWPHIPPELNPQYRGCENVISCVMRAGVAFCIPKLANWVCFCFHLSYIYVDVDYFRAA